MISQAPLQTLCLIARFYSYPRPGSPGLLHHRERRPVRSRVKEPHSILIPPFTGMYVPVMKPLSSLAKNAIALAISSG